MSLQQGEDALRFVFQEEHFGDISVHELGGGRVEGTELWPKDPSGGCRGKLDEGL